MRKKARINGVLALLAITSLVFVLSCGGKAPVKPGAPDWVNKGSGAFPGDQGVIMYGVGVTNKSPNISMMRTKAHNRARTEMAAAMETYVASFIKDFMQEHMDYMDPDSSGSQEFTSAVAKSVTEATLVGAEIVDHWTDPDGNMYALSKMPLDSSFLKAFSNKAAEALRERKAQMLESKANQMLEDLDKELEKKTQRQGY
jgi:hypothetical protein